MIYFLTIAITIAILCLIIMIWHMKKASNIENNSLEKIEKLLEDDDLENYKKITFLLEIKKLYIDSIPWYMKAISSIGVVAFFSMILAALIQTIELTKKSDELKILKKEQSIIYKEEKNFQEIIEILISNIEEQLVVGRIKLSDKHIKLIKYKIEKIEKLPNPNYNKLYRLSIMIGDMEKAFYSIMKIDKKEENLPNIISIAEFQCYQGNRKYAYSLLKKYHVEKKISTLDKTWALKTYILLSYIHDSEIKYLSNIKYLLNTNSITTKRWINKKIGDIERKLLRTKDNL